MALKILMVKPYLLTVGQIKKIDIVIPCAGMGTRLGHLTKRITKNMVLINGISMLEHQLNKFYIHKEKINKIHFILGYKSSVLKKFILKLKLPFKIHFHLNKKYKTTGCAYSFFTTIKYLKNDTLVMNSDLILKQARVTNFFLDKKKNFLFLRKPKTGMKNRVVKAKLNKNRIIKIDITKSNFDYDVVGPFKISLKSILLLKKIHKLIKKKEFSKMSCYTFFGKLTAYVNFRYKILKDGDWYEINNLKEYQKSFKNKIFISKTFFFKSAFNK